MTSRKHGLVLWPWTGWPLNRLFFAVTGLVLLFLVVVLALGIRQYLLYEQCHRAVTAGDRLLFQFTTVKDHLNESLVLGREVNVRGLSTDLQQLQTEVEHLTGNILVPEGIKTSLPSRADLVGLEVRLRSIQEQRQANTVEAAQLVRTMNSLNIGLQQFRLVLGDHTQAILLGLHKIIAGALGLIVAMTCALLFALNRSLAVPLLTLCRLTATVEDDKASEPVCSLHTLIARVHQLLARSDNHQMNADYADSPDPSHLQQAALRYRHAIMGYVSAELVSELTNRINGVLNYTQALIDLDQQEGKRQQTTGVCQALVSEEKKTAELVSALQRASLWQQGRTSSVPLRALFHLLALTLDKPLRTEAIVLDLPAGCSDEALVSAGDLWLVLFTLIHQGRRALNHAPRGTSGEKRLHVECAPHADDPHRLSLLLANSAGAWNEDNRGPIWPSLSFCTHLLHLHGAELIVDATPQTTRLRIELPRSGSVA